MERQLAHARAICARRWPCWTPDEIEEAARDMVEDWMHEAAIERAEGIGQQLDELESIPNCDDAGTGEGRWHGRIG